MLVVCVLALYGIRQEGERLRRNFDYGVLHSYSEFWGPVGFTQKRNTNLHNNRLSINSNSNSSFFFYETSASPDSLFLLGDVSEV